ncbi:hypothetical protein [Hugenholtzia roseola]|uniref:hypothetical protein n=1 Tax=Hugenholtzia roseola TaxID=1002 RepID=UPI0004166F5F|nr:hypothetical protein [Hugenholtzia roseola]
MTNKNKQKKQKKASPKQKRVGLLCTNSLHVGEETTFYFDKKSHSDKKDAIFAEATTSKLHI